METGSILNPEMSIRAHSSPYLYAVVDNLLREDIYEELRRTFPLNLVRPMRSSYRQPGKSVLRNDKEKHEHAFFEVLEVPAWAAFYEWTQNGGYKALVENVVDHVFRRVKSIQFEVSALDADRGEITPHSDSAVKVAAGIFYIPPEKWKRKWGGELEILYQYPSCKKLDAYPQWDEVRTHEAVSYQPNRLVCFKRTPKNISQHGVRPLRGPKGTWRQSVTLTLMK